MSGKLHDEDYKKFVPLVDVEIAKEGKVNVLAWFHVFKGWDLKALWAIILRLLGLQPFAQGLLVILRTGMSGSAPSNDLPTSQSDPTSPRD